MNQLQNKLLEMFKWLKNFMEKNSINYYVIGGTMLGAVRHEGFIPWDDDIDIALPRKDYEKLISLFSNPIENYMVEFPTNNDKEYTYNYAKLYDMNTSMTELARKPLKRGIFIDIFPLDGIGNTIEESIKNYKKIDRKNMLLAMKMCKIRKERKWWKNLSILVGRFIPCNIKKLSIKIDKLLATRKFEESTYVGNLVSTYRSREIMERRIFGNPTQYKFEGIMVTGPEFFDEYLTTLFKNWRDLPPIEKQKSAHDFYDIDYNKSWMK